MSNHLQCCNPLTQHGTSVVLEPIDFRGATSPLCPGEYPRVTIVVHTIFYCLSIVVVCFDQVRSECKRGSVHDGSRIEWQPGQISPLGSSRVFVKRYCRNASFFLVTTSHWMGVLL